MALLTLLPLLLLAVGFIYKSFKRYRHSSPVHHIPGPPSSSWLYGNLNELLFDFQYGTNEFAWTRRFGPIYRIKGCFGQDILMVSDPTALRYILNNLEFFTRSPFQLHATRAMLNEKNLVSAEGDVHARYRNVMNGAFTAALVKNLVPSFQNYARDLIEQWQTALAEYQQVDVYRTIQNLTLDAAGAAVGYEFNAIGNAGSPQVTTHHNVVQVSLASKRSKASVLAESSFLYLPTPVLRLALRLPTPTLLQLHHAKGLKEKLSQGVLRAHLDALNQKFESERDLFSTILENNLGLPSTQSMDEEALCAQIATILVAAQDTTGNSISWALYELAKDLDWQDKLRAEISVATNVPDNEHITYDTLKYLNAHIKETLRYHSTVPILEKMVSRDTVIPLSCPITTTTGEKLSEIPVQSGQFIYIAMSSYNRLESVWGENAHQFNPQRWLEETGQHTITQSLGPYANLMTFGSGPKACIGWRYAVIEIQVVLAELLRKFRFTIPDGAVVRRIPTITLFPAAADGTPALPLIVHPV